MKTLRIVLILILIVLSMAATGCRKVEPVSQEVTLAMGYIPNVQFAPIYVAVKKGFFAEQGIQLKFDYGWETDLLKLVATGELKFAVASGDQVILARSQGLPVVYVMNWYRRYPVSVTALADQGIKTPQDLPGKTIGIPATYGASYVGWRALLYAAGINPDSVKLKTIGYAQVPVMLEKQVNGAVCYIMNEPVQLAQAGYEVISISVSDYIDLVSNGFITNAQTVQKEPILVQGMVSAALKGLQYTLDHPDEAFDISLEFIPEMKSADIPLQKAVLYKSVEVWMSDQLGESSAESWQTSVDFMKAVGFIQEAPKISDLFTNRFVEAWKK
jgi:NitT/TauT family transport system substrate-binding protein